MAENGNGRRKPVDVFTLARRNLVLEIVLTAFFLGVCFALGVALIVHSIWISKSVEEYAAGVYIVSSMVLFHLSEFIVAAVCGRGDTHPSAFMLFHSWEYTAAMVAAWLEFAVEALFIPENWKLSENSQFYFLFRLNSTTASVAGILTVLFYMVRVCAMLQCGTNFSLVIETERRDCHVLVDSGIYGVLRHPAYFGFFWKSVASQVVLANPICLVVHSLMLLKFFKERIAYEEYLLMREDFFGERYKAYKERTWVGIPFVS
ncbi:putative Phospholipid methyltransferase Isoprenylcysteine carboxyl methyltransferase (ICMT) family [Trypanosoma vivax]|uniref:Protein-S-isoprenylcysteine O-methyltransferase n=1 Tax=Trypanosoma vivax (strain Y486) TaxID=1055687 RepID=G0U3D4_TRYVY|nr:putative Phospholipid methyltransferase Isoprenylcysteine carboxyl methyltransferase (ICMT) family [Trypanosoma vivax]KAH8620951.1 putative Phospholipid methyltransferase Isoprenylcysteine carboxyl methyltransferase (ICMT) family [Trypanosoma vivax]CCC50790.1 putative prenyl protein specific carboxyl methyltransferase [Trypanosoma vivax Y486]